MGKFKKLQEDIENVTNKEVVKQTRISGVATIVLIISVACAIGGMSFEDPNSSMPTFLFTASALLFLVESLNCWSIVVAICSNRPKVN